MRYIVLINLLMMLIHTTSLAETATTGNLLPNAGTGQTSVQHSNSTIDGITNSNNWTLNNITDYSSNYNELEAQGTGTVSTNGSLLNISAGDHTTTEDSLDGGVTLTSKTEVQNCEWVGSSHQCGQATNGRDTYSTTVTILDENDTELATVTQNRNTDSGYNNNTFTYTDTVSHTGEGARKWQWKWEGVDGNNSNSTAAVGPNLLGAELKATLLDILYSPLPVEIKTEITEIFQELSTEFDEIEEIIEEFFIEEEIAIEEAPIVMEESIMTVMMEIKEEENFEEEPIFEETVMLIEEEKEEEEPVMQVVSMLTEEKEEKEELDNSAEEGIIEVSEKESEEEEKNEQPEEVKEDESNGETTETANASEKNNTKQKNIQSKETKTVSHTDILNKIDEKIKDIGKNLELKNLITLKAMSENDILLSTYNVPFYQPKTIYVDQINITDDRKIYNNINLNSYIKDDPIAIRANKINELKIERQQLLIQLEVLNNG